METETQWARTLGAMTDDDVVATLMAELRKMYTPRAARRLSQSPPLGAQKLPTFERRIAQIFRFPGAPEPTASVVARMNDNAFQRGGFSFMPPGGSAALRRSLWEPLAGGRVLLAGEHTSDLHAGTVHGAVVSGRQAAAQARVAMRGEPASAVAAAAEAYVEEYRARLYRANYGDDDEAVRSAADSLAGWGGLGGGAQQAADGQERQEDEELWDRNP